MAEPATAWKALEAELAAWAATGRSATFWWRDDDAANDSAALNHLLHLSDEFSLPLALAVVPKLVDASLLRAIDPMPRITPIVHGYAHINHAPAHEKQAEFGGHRSMADMCAELAQGLALLRDRFGGRLLPILVPPWNRLDTQLAPHLPSLGYCGLSSFRSAAQRLPAPGLVQTNCHIDSIDWHALRGQRPAQAVLEEMTTLLRVRRLYPDIASDRLVFGKPLPAGFDPNEPTGILTHHLIQDAQSWEFLSQLLRILSAHCRDGGGARWLDCAEAFKADAAAAV